MNCNLKTARVFFLCFIEKREKKKIYVIPNIGGDQFYLDSSLSLPKDRILFRCLLEDWNCQSPEESQKETSQRTAFM